VEFDKPAMASWQQPVAIRKLLTINMVMVPNWEQTVFGGVTMLGRGQHRAKAGCARGVLNGRE
jgi:hypothetical protein